MTEHDRELGAAYAAGHDTAIAKCRPYLRSYAHHLWIDGQYAENAAICKLLGEPTAEEHELGEDRP